MSSKAVSINTVLKIRGQARQRRPGVSLRIAPQEARRFEAGSDHKKSQAGKRERAQGPVQNRIGKRPAGGPEWLRLSGTKNSGIPTGSGCKQHPELREQFTTKIILFEKDAFHPSLKTHSLSGVLRELWSFRITYGQRLVFAFLDESRTKVLLIDIGTHEEVY
jgi:mRNA-degrading endonuclease YafQ of YafQ-DinJ toxin-antitoxin module